MKTEDREAQTPEQKAAALEGAAVRMMLELDIPAVEVAEWTANARRRRVGKT